jgi:hypothetical protein
MRNLKHVVFSTLFVAIASGALSQETGRPPLKRFSVKRATTKITVDGRLEEPAWNDATVIELGYEWFPGENAKPPVRTECFITYSTSHLYVGFRAYDPEPKKIRAHLMDRDQIFTLIQDDYVGFMLDAFNDQRRALQFRINPLGVQAEALNTLFSEDWEWDIIWDSHGRITPEGYEVEVAVPFNQLRFPSSDRELTFGFSAMRSWPRNVRHRLASNYRDFGDTCFFCQYDKVTGFVGLKPGYNIEVDPTLTASRTDRRPDGEGDLEEGDFDVEPGLFGRWGITSSATFSGTVNPDFSQVEADVGQLEVNERFALFFPETRPFFLEGMDFFQTPLPVVFTRTVVDPAGGGKFNAKFGTHNVGVFATKDRVNNLLIPSNQFSTLDSIEQDVLGTVLRYRGDLGRSSALGVIYTGREATDYFNRLSGMDGQIQIASADTIEFQYLTSYTMYPEELAARNNQPLNAFKGRAITFDYNHHTRNWLWSVSYEDLSPEFRADFGFVPRVDTRTVEGIFRRTFWNGDGGGWVNFSLTPSFSRTIDFDGNLTDQTAEIAGQFQGALQTNLIVSVSGNKELYNGTTFDLNQTFFHFELQPAGSTKFKIDGLVGDEIDSFNTQKGELVNLRPGLELKLGRHINLNLNHSYQRLDVEGGRLFEENLSELRAYYYLNLRSLVRLVAQYRSIANEPSLFPIDVPPEVDRLMLQFLFSYKLNPRTVVFLGYSDNYEGYRGTSLTQTSRTLFFKLGYALTL